MVSYFAPRQARWRAVLPFLSTASRVVAPSPTKYWTALADSWYVHRQRARVMHHCYVDIVEWYDWLLVGTWSSQESDISLKCCVCVQWKLSHFIRGCQIHQVVIFGVYAIDEWLYLLVVILDLGHNSVFFNRFRMCIINCIDNFKSSFYFYVWVMA